MRLLRHRIGSTLGSGVGSTLRAGVGAPLGALGCCFAIGCSSLPWRVSANWTNCSHWKVGRFPTSVSVGGARRIEWRLERVANMRSSVVAMGMASFCGNHWSELTILSALVLVIQTV